MTGNNWQEGIFKGLKGDEKKMWKEAQASVNIEVLSRSELKGRRDTARL